MTYGLLLAAGLLLSNPPIQVEVNEHDIVTVEAAVQLPCGHSIIHQRIHCPPELKYRQDTERRLRLYVTGEPGTHELVVEVIHAETAELPDGRLVAVLPYQEQAVKVTVTVKAQAPRPPPIDPPDPPDPAPTKPAAGAYIYESEEGPVPVHVDVATRQLNGEGQVRMEQVDKDTRTGSGEVPVQLSKSIEAAKAAGLPAIVLRDEAGEVLATLSPVPKTAEQIVDWVHSFTGQ